MGRRTEQSAMTDRPRGEVLAEQGERAVSLALFLPPIGIPLAAYYAWQVRPYDAEAASDIASQTAVFAALWIIVAGFVIFRL